MWPCLQSYGEVSLPHYVNWIICSGLGVQAHFIWHVFRVFKLGLRSSIFWLKIHGIKPGGFFEKTQSILTFFTGELKFRRSVCSPDVKQLSIAELTLMYTGSCLLLWGCFLIVFSSSLMKIHECWLCFI